VEDEIDLANVEGLADVLSYKIKSSVISEMVNVRASAGEQVVNHHHLPALAEQSIAEMRSQETGAAGDQSALLAHAFLAPFLKAAGTPSG
jgi:F0F1-type ATP synthase epsilon subunit